MKSNRDLAWVGLFVLIASALLIGTVLAVAGTFTASGVSHRAYFKSATGLTSGATVRFGGMKAGRVETVRLNPRDPTQIEIDFTVQRDIPVKVDSVATITTLGALDEHYLEVGTGTTSAPLAPPDSEVKSLDSAGIGDLENMIGSLGPVARESLQQLNQRLTELQVTIARANDLLSDKNRANVSDGLANLDGLLAENRPKVSATLANVQAASSRIQPMLNDLKETMAQANLTLSHVDSVVVENRQDIRNVVVELRETMATAATLVDQLKNTTDNNTDNIDQIFLNLRVTTENMKQLTDTLKSRPSTLIRGNTSKDRIPGEKAE